jgi:hypothetical protein
MRPASVSVREKFGRLTVLKFIGVKGRNRDRRFRCKCLCGKIVDVNGSSLSRSGHPTRSCGCIRDERFLNRTHGMSRKPEFKPEYQTWEAMIQRCHNKNHTNFKNYGGRGISVCARWRRSFYDFFNDLVNEIGRKPSSKVSIDRIENNGNYEPGNIRWATGIQQQLNRRISKKKK